MQKNRLVYNINRYANIFGINNPEYIKYNLLKKHKNVPKDFSYLIDSTSFLNIEENWGVFSAQGVRFMKIQTPYDTGVKIEQTGSKTEGFPLFYMGPEIIYYANHTYKIAFKVKFLKGDNDSFSVGWWVDDGGMGYGSALNLNKNIDTLSHDWYSCSAEYTFRDNHYALVGFINSVNENSEFIITDFSMMDLNYNSSLPRFLFEIKDVTRIKEFLDRINPPFFVDSNLVINGNFINGLNFWKSNADSTTIDLKVVDGKNCALISRKGGNGGGFSLFHDGRKINFWANNNYKLEFKVKLIYPKNKIPFYVGYWINEGEGYIINLKQEIDTLNDGWLLIKANYKFKNDQSNLFFPINSQIDNSQFLISDLRLINMTNHQTSVTNNSIAESEVRTILFTDRTERWRFGINYWSNDFNWYQKIFGKGYEYIKKYGEEFLGDSKLNDYPHNPFITILLYSGIFGLLMYLYLLYKTIYLYILYLKEYSIFFFGFLITFFFTFFSGSHPFDPPIMGFFMILPFFIHSILKKEVSSNKPV